jgi:hypothetical protein
MATHQIMRLWLGGITLLWALQPLLWSHARGVLTLSLVTVLLALIALSFKLPLLTTWSAAVGLCNLTLALLLSSQPPNLWAGLGAGVTLLAMLDSSHRFAYISVCQLTPGVLTSCLRVFIQLSSLALAAGVLLSLIIPLAYQSISASAAGMLTISGACLVAGFTALFLLRANHDSMS